MKKSEWKSERIATLESLVLLKAAERDVALYQYERLTARLADAEQVMFTAERFHHDGGVCPGVISYRARYEK